MTLDHLDAGVLLVDAGGTIVYASPGFDAIFERPIRVAPGTSRGAFIGEHAAFFESPDDVSRRLGVDPGGPYSGREILRLALPRPKTIRWTATPVPKGNGFAQLETFTDISG